MATVLQPSHADPSSTLPPPPEDPRLRVLVVEDEDTVRDMLIDLLAALGHEAVGTSRGSEGLRLLNEQAFDFVFTDLSMPEMDGWTVARRVRELRPGAQVVLVTGYAAGIELDAEKATLVDSVVGKPFTLGELEAALARPAPRSEEREKRSID